MCLQAYDFTELANRHNCRLQIGGSDQWGNIVSGIELGKRVNTPQLYGLTTPLLKTASGEKMGKSAKKAAWLNADMLDPFEFWQYWRNVHDEDVIKFLKLFTTIEVKTINKEYGKVQGEELNDIKKILATAVTTLVHGKEQAGKAEKTAEQTFEDQEKSMNLPTESIHKNRINGGIRALEFIVEIKLAKSNGEARRFMEGGALRINDQPLNDGARIIKQEMFDNDGCVKVSLGKKKHILVNLTS